MSALDPRQLATALGLLGIVTASAVPIGIELARSRRRSRSRLLSRRRS
jgi:hypothetical protein